MREPIQLKHLRGEQAEEEKEEEGGGEHEQDDDDDGDGGGAECDKDENGSGDGNIIIDNGDDELRLMRQQIQLKHLGLQKKDGKFSQMFLVGVSNEH